jgi:hypothetical protein
VLERYFSIDLVFEEGTTLGNEFSLVDLPAFDPEETPLEDL